MVNPGVVRMRALKVLISGLVLTAMLGGCGQKGALYRDNPDAVADAAVQSGAAGNSHRDPRQDESTGQ